MPFKSEKQRRFLWANEPEIAKKWTAKYGSNPSKEDTSKEERSRRIRYGPLELINEKEEEEVKEIITRFN